MFPCIRCRIEANQIDGNAWSGFLNPLFRIEGIVHSFNAAECMTTSQDIAHAKCSVLNNHFGDNTSACFLLSFQAGTQGQSIWIGLVLVEFGNCEHGFQQLIQAETGFGTRFNHFHIAAPFARDQFAGCQALQGFIFVDTN